MFYIIVIKTIIFVKILIFFLQKVKSLINKIVSKSYSSAIMSWCRGQNIVFSMSALCKNLENLIFHSRLVIRSFIESESKGYLRLIFKLIPDFVHSFPDPFGIRRVSWNLKLLFCFRRRIYLVVYLLEVCQGGNSFGYWLEWFPHHFSALLSG